MAGLGLFHHVGTQKVVVSNRLYLQGGILADGLSGDLLHAHHAIAKLLVGPDQLAAGRVVSQYHIVAIENGKGLVAHKFPGAANGVAQALGLFLPHIEDVGQLGDAHNLLQNPLLGRVAGKPPLQLGSAVKVVLQKPLAAVCDNENVLDARSRRLLYNILDSGLVHNGQHFLGHYLGGGKHPSAQSRRWNNSLAHFFHKKHLLLKSPVGSVAAAVSRRKKRPGKGATPLHPSAYSHRGMFTTII